MCKPLRIQTKCEMCRRLYKAERNFKPWNYRERWKTYNVSSFWFHFAIWPLTRTSLVLAVVSELDTVTRTFLLRREYLLTIGTLTARRTKKKIKNEASRNWDFLTSTNLSPQCVARIVQVIVFRAIRRYERCSRMVLNQYHCTKERIDTPSSCALRCRGTWAGTVLEQ